MPIQTERSHSIAPTVALSSPAEPVDRNVPVGPGRIFSHRVAMLLPLQLFLAAGWLRASIEKVIDPTWWSGVHLGGFLDEQRPFMLPWFRVFADYVVEPLAPMILWLVVAMQLLIAVCLIANHDIKAALWAGIILNVSFTMAGRVNPSVFYLVMQLALLFVLARPVRERIALRRAVLWLVPAVLVAPFTRTLHPAHVIDDPALMLSFVAVVASTTTIAVSVDPRRISDTVRSAGPRAVAVMQT